MMQASSLTVDPARSEDRGLVERLMQLYLHDSAEFASPDIDAEGVFAYPHFESYWQGDPARTIHLFRTNGAVAGFGFVNDWAPSGREVDHVLAEFFVLRPYRRSGVGWEASTRLFASLPGAWEVGVLGHNVSAVNFWRTALRADPIRELEETSGPEGRWEGTVFRFRTD